MVFPSLHPIFTPYILLTTLFLFLPTRPRRMLALGENDGGRALDDPAVTESHSSGRHICAYLTEIRSLQKQCKKLICERIDDEVEVEHLKRDELRGID